MSTWSSLTQEQQKEVFSQLKAAAEAHGKPSQLKIKANIEIVNILNAGKQENNQTLQISASFPESSKALADALKASIQEAVSGVSDAIIQIECAKTIGSDMGLLENVGFLTGEETTTVKHEPGQVILLDFWATWCPPCQKPMAHNQEMLEKHAPLGDWKNVRIIGLSRDQDQKKLEQHVADKKWTSVEHYWQANGKGNSHKDFKVNGIPHCVLVDTHGKIVWVGHPASRNLEEDINNLLAGKVLDVKADADSDEEEE